MAHRNKAVNDSEAAFESDAFTCCICFGRLLNVKMCPHCSKMFHAKCIGDWLEIKQSCPNCRRHLLPGQAVACRWVKEIMQHFDELEDKTKRLAAERSRIIESLKRGTEKYAFKVIIIGDMFVGKTALLRRFADESFEPQKSTTGFEFVHRRVVISGDVIRLVLVDTAGQEQFDSITTGFYRDSDAIIIAYDVVNKKTFERIQVWHNKAVLHAEKSPVMLLVATKTDLWERRQVTLEEGQALADKLGIRYLETSSLHNTNVEETFYSIAAILKARMDEDMEKNFKNKFKDETIILTAGSSSSSRTKKCPKCS